MIYSNELDKVQVNIQYPVVKQELDHSYIPGCGIDQDYVFLLLAELFPEKVLCGDGEDNGQKG